MAAERMPSLARLVERRAVPRQSTNERGLIILAGNGTRACIVTDLSPKGARIGLGTDTPLPLRFEIQFPKSGRRVPAQLVWQRGLIAGVQFAIKPTWSKRLKLRLWFSPPGG